MFPPKSIEVLRLEVLEELKSKDEAVSDSPRTIRTGTKLKSKTSKEIAAEMAAQIKKDPGAFKGGLVAATVGAGYRVNQNVASHALRRLEKLGLIQKGGKSVAGNIIYHLKPKGTSVKAPKYYGKLSTIGKPSLMQSKDEPSVRDLISELKSLDEGGLVIGAHGLSKPKSGLRVQKNTVYHIGASSSPSMILVTSVSKDMVRYQHYPFGKKGKTTSSQMWIFQDLAIQGMTTWLKTYGKYQPQLARAYEKLMSDKPVKPNGDGYQPVKILAKAAKPGEDLWREAERYGSVGGLGEKDDMTYEIRTDMNALENLKKDKQFKILKVTKE